MKKSIFTLLSLLFVVSMVWAQSAKRYALAEHFTQASCGPCAAQNPAFSAFYTAHEGQMHHIAYHTSWPGVDPMNAANAPEVQDRVDYYGVNGVPDIWLSGKIETAPGGVSEGMLAAIDAAGSPIFITASETTVGTQRNVEVKVHTVNTVPTGNYVLRVAVVEKMVNYTTAPGTNGEKDFPNVFRKMLPNTTGDAVTFAPIGQATTMSYSYALSPSWDATEIYVIAWVQNETNKEVLNSGSSRDWQMSYISTTPTMHQTPAGATAASDGSIINYSGATFEYADVQITADAPADWTATIMQNGQPFTPGVLTVNPATSVNLGLNVVPGATIALGKYTVTMTSLTNPNFVIKKSYIINNGIKDLVVGHKPDNQPLYTAGLVFANNVVHGDLTSDEYFVANSANILQGLYNIYYNVGWDFPAISTNMVNNLTPFLDNGGNLLICGQDIGWDVFDPTGNSTAQPIKDFYNNYMHATYLADGGTTNNMLTPEATDIVYGTMSSSPIVDAHNGNFYPDEIAVANGGLPIFKYGATTKVAGVRYDGTYKVVYLPIGIEMISNTAVRNEFVKRTHDWFYTDIVSVDPAFENALGQNYPNPCDIETVIPVSMDNIATATLQITDIVGQVVYSQTITEGAKYVTVSTENLASGTYMYQFVANGKTSAAKKLVVAH